MRTSFSLAFFLRLLYPLIGRFETLLFQFRSRGTRERILISFRRSEKSRFFVKTANWPPLSVFSGALGLVFVFICYFMLVLFCGFFRCFRRFGVFFELVFNSDCIRKKENAVPMQPGVRVFGRAKTNYIIAKHVYTRRFVRDHSFLEVEAGKSKSTEQ